MQYCTGCGKELPIGAKFCIKCGTKAPIEREAQKQTVDIRKVKFDGEAFLCAGCGGKIGAFDLACPYCGAELRNRNAAFSVQDLAERLNQIEAHRIPERTSLTDTLTHHVNATDARKASCITSYPIPNTKEDIVEFMMMASANVNARVYDGSNGYVPEGQKVVADAWMSKMDQAYEKAKLLLNNDAEIDQIERIYLSVNKRVKSEKTRIWRLLGIIYGVIIGFVVLVVALLYFASH